MRSLKTAALIAAGAGACHLVLAFSDLAHPLMVVMMLALAALCVPCTVGLWRKPSEHAATAMLFLTVVMIIAHSATIPAHDHGAGASPGLVAPALSPLTIVPLILDLVVTVQLALWLRRHHRSSTRASALHLSREVTEAL